MGARAAAAAVAAVTVAAVVRAAMVEADLEVVPTNTEELREARVAMAGSVADEVRYG